MAIDWAPIIIDFLRRFPDFAVISLNHSVNSDVAIEGVMLNSSEFLSLQLEFLKIFLSTLLCISPYDLSILLTSKNRSETNFSAKNESDSQLSYRTEQPKSKPPLFPERKKLRNWPVATNRTIGFHLYSCHNMPLHTIFFFQNKINRIELFCHASMTSCILRIKVSFSPQLQN